MSLTRERVDAELREVFKGYPHDVGAVRWSKLSLAVERIVAEAVAGVTSAPMPQQLNDALARLRAALPERMLDDVELLVLENSVATRVAADTMRERDAATARAEAAEEECAALRDTIKWNAGADKNMAKVKAERDDPEAATAREAARDKLTRCADEVDSALRGLEACLHTGWGMVHENDFNARGLRLALTTLRALAAAPVQPEAPHIPAAPAAPVAQDAGSTHPAT